MAYLLDIHLLIPGSKINQLTTEATKAIGYSLRGQGTSVCALCCSLSWAYGVMPLYSSKNSEDIISFIAYHDEIAAPSLKALAFLIAPFVRNGDYIQATDGDSERFRYVFRNGKAYFVKAVERFPIENEVEVTA